MMQNSDKRLFLLDAMALVYRAYYAMMRSPRITSKGKNTNAQFGFTNTLVELINKEKPTHLAVVFDTAAPTERHTDFADYKGNRPPAPEDLIAALPDIKKIIEGFNIPVLEKDGYEADDIIGTLALSAADKGYEVFMVTPDKDYGQIVRPNIFIYKPAYKGGDFEILGEKEICAKWDIANTDQVIDMLGLMGDTADNIPGIPGIGEKTACKLLKQYNSLENILDHADEIPGSIGKKVQEGKESALISKKLATIITNVPIEVNEEQIKMCEWNKPVLAEIFNELEFRTLGKRILGTDFNQTNNNANAQTDLFGNIVESNSKANASVALELFPEYKNIHNTPHEYHLIDNNNQLDAFIKLIEEEKTLCFDTETTGLDAMQADLVGMSFAWKTAVAYYINCPSDRVKTLAILNKLAPFFNNPNIIWIGQNIKYDMLILKNYGFTLKGSHFDTMIADYCFEPESKRGMDFLSTKYLGYEPVHIEELINKKGKAQKSMRDVPPEQVKEYAAEDADITLQLKPLMEEHLKENEVEELFYEVENPLVPVLAKMEFEGIKLDVPFLKEYGVQLGTEIAEAEKNVYELAGVQFNLSSPKQLGEVLFEKLKLNDKAKKTKTGQYATGEDVLQKLRSKHPIIEDILTYRELTKLKSTYVDALPEMVNPKTERVHTSYNQSVVITGRLSSNNPNLQNIPIRTDKGKEIRKAFIAPNEDTCLISCDYSQIELRVMAAMSGDANMIEAFKENKDIHRATAAKVYGIAEEKVTSTMRRNAKAVNFGIIYGQSAFGLSESLGISRSEAKEIIENYFKLYSSVKSYMDESIKKAQLKGYVETLMGRKIKLSDINSSNFTVRGFAERVAINAPIQGSAADMIKLAMIKIDKELLSRNLKSKMLLQVHDELIFETPLSEKDELLQLIPNLMAQALKLPNEVPIIAEAGFGKNWLDAH